ncbi:MAG: chorismate-binding protein [Oligoflexia bacterium]|nr:chorismate-binding protein [Oligoflexia bacterium]
MDTTEWGRTFSLIPIRNSDKNTDQWIKFSNPLYLRLYYPNSCITYDCAETGAGQTQRPFTFENFCDYLRQFRFTHSHDDYSLPTVFYLCYELGYYFEEVEHLLERPLFERPLLAVEIKYQDVEKLMPETSARTTPELHLDLDLDLDLLSAPTFDEYQTAFQRGYQELLRGNCYQFNLTYQYQYQYRYKDPAAAVDPVDHFTALFINLRAQGNLSPYAQLTFLPPLDLLILSNTPEGLFTIKKLPNHFLLTTTPIKGTASKDAVTPFADPFANPKEQGELDMISDLLRNDLSRIEFPNATILARRRRLAVPQLLHQYSIIQAELSYNVTLYEILRRLFPGGSITGAPKKSVLKILHQLENGRGIDRGRGRGRGFYTGSTIILHRSLLAASINIRTAVIDLKNQKLSYGSGGGITLLSNPKDEFAEMNAKVQSFFSALFRTAAGPLIKDGL